MIPRPEFGKIFAYLASAYPRHTYPKETISVYYDTLAELDSDTLKVACKKWVSEEKWFPKASELRKLVYTSGQVETSADRKKKYAGSIELMNAALAYRRLKLPAVRAAVELAGGERQLLEDGDVDG